MLKLLGVTAELTAREQKDGSDVLTFRQVWEGAPVFNCEITLSYQAGSLYRIEGQRLFGSASASGTPEMVNLPTLLIRFLGQRNESGRMFSEIRSISAGYQYSGSRPYTLTPVWYVETEHRSLYPEAVPTERCSKRPLPPHVYQMSTKPTPEVLALQGLPGFLYPPRFGMSTKRLPVGTFGF